MGETLIVGDGPAGLSAALLLAKKGERARVFGKDKTKMHQAYLYNYPGIKQIDGSEFIETTREQCRYFGAELYDRKITEFDKNNDGDEFVLTDEVDDQYIGDYLILATGHFVRNYSSELDVETDEAGRVIVDDHARTNVTNAYAAGVATRTQRIQVTISVGQGAAAALDIIDKEQNGVPNDFDTRADTHLRESS